MNEWFFIIGGGVVILVLVLGWSWLVGRGKKDSKA